MKSKISILSKDNGFVGQFKDLNVNEMSSLRGGVKPVPPPPPSPGDDYPIVLPAMTSNSLITSCSTQQLPVINIPSSSTSSAF